MASIIIHASDLTHLDRTIDALVDQTPSSLLSELIVCNSAAGDYVRPGVKVLDTRGRRRPEAWNFAASGATDGDLVFLRDTTKVGADWLEPLVGFLAQHETALVSPIVHTLDVPYWAAEPFHWKRFGWRWDLRLVDRPGEGYESPAISASCLVVKRQWLNELGMFDEEGAGIGDDVELSIRSWLFGGEVAVVDQTRLAAAYQVAMGPEVDGYLARIVEAWLPEYASQFYGAIGTIAPAGGSRFDNLMRLRTRQKRQADWFVAHLQPELIGVYALRDAAAGKSIAVVGPGPSLDYVAASQINRHDVVICVDQVGELFEADYVVTDNTHSVLALQRKYKPNQFVLPILVENRTMAKLVPAKELLPGSVQFEMGQRGALPVRLDPPLCDNAILAAIQLALFMRPSSVTLFGVDIKLVGGKSHTSKIEIYDGGKLWPDSEATRYRLAAFEAGLHHLGGLAQAANIPLLRVSHA